MWEAVMDPTVKPEHQNCKCSGFYVPPLPTSTTAAHSYTHNYGATNFSIQGNNIPAMFSPYSPPIMDCEPAVQDRLQSLLDLQYQCFHRSLLNIARHHEMKIL